MFKEIFIKGAKEHNLKNIDVSLKKDQMNVITGPSGSGKSSLAFDTIFAEGQRRYIESLSSYARQFLGQMKKPDVDYIQGLSPAISIEQKTTHKNPRSTVGTLTEIYDYYRLLYARLGQVICPRCSNKIQEQSIDQIIDHIFAQAKDQQKLMILAPMVRQRKGEYKQLLEEIQQLGFVRVSIDGTVELIDQVPPLNKNHKHDIQVVVDRLLFSREQRQRLAESLEMAMRLAKGVAIVQFDGEAVLYSEKNSCAHCGYSFVSLEPHLFSFNSPVGACPECHGLGMLVDFDEKKVIPNKKYSLLEGAIKPYDIKKKGVLKFLENFLKTTAVSIDQPIQEYPQQAYEQLLWGNQDKKTPFMGVMVELRKRREAQQSLSQKLALSHYTSHKVCSKCSGKRLSELGLSVYIHGKNIYELTQYSAEKSLEFFQKGPFEAEKQAIYELIVREIVNRLQFMVDVGLNYLSLDRSVQTLSGGEMQRIRLASQIGSQLTGVLYVLDEPTIGLHQQDNQRLIHTLLKLRDLGNTLVVVEHDEQTIAHADYVVDIGPAAGVYGGQLVSAGTVDQLMKDPHSITGPYLSGEKSISVDRKKIKNVPEFIQILQAKENNLQNIDIKIPLGALTLVTGISGSGKSTLVNDILYPAVAEQLGYGVEKIGSYGKIKGLEQLNKVINIDQSPIGRTPRSNPATYVEVFGHIRKLFAQLPEAKLRGYKEGRFSFNVPGGRCQHCQGEGTLKVQMHFLPDVQVLCSVCQGKRFNQETLEVKLKGKSIFDVLQMSVDQALEFFKNNPSIYHKLATLKSVGLGYIQLGQKATSVSGGEAQRIKLAFELSKKDSGKTLYIIDEPTTGLHFVDIPPLLNVLNKLVEKGNTIVVIEHNIDVIKQADYVIDLGPKGGDYGGKVLFQGFFKQFLESRDSYTAYYVRQALKLKSYDDSIVIREKKKKNE